MESNLLREFCEKVNEHGIVYHIYRNHAQKNQWSIICSAMDWLSIVVENIDTRKLQKDNSNAASIKVMNFIMCIDVLWEAIQQLHRVFFDTRTIPFAEDNTCFHRKIAPASDNDYFKMLRACFAAHPVNLEDCFCDCKKRERRYASWSFGGNGAGDFSVILYSNEVDKKTIHLDIWFDELLLFAQKRYEYLRILMERIDSITRDFFRERQSRKIEKADDPLSQLQILKQASLDRLNSDFYNYRLDCLCLILGTDVTDSRNKMVVQRYQVACIKEISVIYDALQTMDFTLPEAAFPGEVEVPEKCLYSFSKVSDAVWGREDPSLLPLSPIKEILSGIIQLENCQSIQELYVVITAGFFALQSDTTSRYIDSER